MHPVADVVLEVLEIHEGRLGEVVIGQVEVAGLGRDDGLHACRQGRVADRDGLVVGEVASLLLGSEAVPARIEREDEVGLLDDLPAVQLEVGVVQQQRIAIWSRPREVPRFVIGECLGLRMNLEVGVVGHDDVLGGRAPRAELRGLDAELHRSFGMTSGAVRRGT